VGALRLQLATTGAEFEEARKLAQTKTRNVGILRSYGSRHVGCLRRISGSLRAVADNLLDLLQAQSGDAEPQEVRETRELEMVE
jgi:hypothetical protein